MTTQSRVTASDLADSNPTDVTDSGVRVEDTRVTPTQNRPSNPTVYPPGVRPPQDGTEDMNWPKGWTVTDNGSEYVVSSSKGDVFRTSVKADITAHISTIDGDRES